MQINDMDEIDRLFRRLDHNCDFEEIRIDIANLIGKLLIERRDKLDNWVNEHLAYAIALLAQNTFSVRQPSPSWLRASLVNIEKALVHPDQRSEINTRGKNPFDTFTFDQLLDDIRKLGGTYGMPAGAGQGGQCN